LPGSQARPVFGRCYGTAQFQHFFFGKTVHLTDHRVGALAVDTAVTWLTDEVDRFFFLIGERGLCALVSQVFAKPFPE